MTQCCDTYGNCTQGRDCPARTGIVLPHQEAHTKRMEANECATEGGNVWFAEPEPVGLTPMESGLIYTSIVIGAVVSLAILAGATGWIYQTFIGG